MLFYFPNSHRRINLKPKCHLKNKYYRETKLFRPQPPNFSAYWPEKSSKGWQQVILDLIFRLFLQHRANRGPEAEADDGWRDGHLQHGQGQLLRHLRHKAGRRERHSYCQDQGGFD
jgi:hypothetical protein